MKQVPMFPPEVSWSPPETLPDLMQARRIAVDLETKDPELKTFGPGWAVGKGNIGTCFIE